MDFTFHNYQEDWNLKKNENGYYLEAYFDFEIENVEQDEMRVGKVTVDLYGFRKINFEFDNDYKYESIMDEVLGDINEELIDNALEFIKKVEQIKNLKPKIIDKKVHTEIVRGEKKFYCLFEYDGINESFTALMKDRKVDFIIRHNKNVLDSTFVVTDILDQQEIIDHFYLHSKDRIRLMY